MIHTLRGIAIEHAENFFVLDVHGVGFKIFSNGRTIARLPKNGETKIFSFLYVREDRLDLFGFLEEETLRLFEMLNAVTGIGPKTALGVLDIDTVPNVMAAILERRVELLSRAPGIGKKTAERVVLELHNKIHLTNARALTEQMTADKDVEEVLVELGYPRGEVRRTIESIGGEGSSVEDRLRLALKTLGKTRQS